MHPHDAPSARPDAGGVPHRTTTTERGAFALARCACGWHGPARRSRERARTDAVVHLSEQGPPPPR
ncbi:hypothetical protein LUX01_13110 [Streptomyces sudanensis]|uniref:hypothetical protein n=1 Tax=Streptomyces sudanensis TaxID=436397 RepID=UPI0020CBB64D|nr:hypothetical protein [Streptomyces sudanensis]MCP9987486.1 hypothetical protein [Streptomyces sudanensis]